MYDTILNYLGKQNIENQELDRCNDVTDIVDLVLLANTKFSSCKKLDENDMTRDDILNYKYKQITKLPIIDVIKDNTIEYYKKHPDCCPLPLWKILHDKIEFDLGVTITTKSNISSKPLLTTLIKSGISKNKIQNIFKVVKNSGSKNNTNSSIFGKGTSATISTQVKHDFSKAGITIDVINNDVLLKHNNVTFTIKKK